MTCFWADVRVREASSEAELADLGDPAKLFANVNTPEDFRT